MSGPNGIMHLILAALAGMVAHEFGHALIARMVGAEIKGWGIALAGPYVHIRIEPPNRMRCLLCLSGGPAANLVLFFALALTPLRVVAWVNLYLAVMNLVLPKSDGWKMLVEVAK